MDRFKPLLGGPGPHFTNNLLKLGRSGSNGFPCPPSQPHFETLSLYAGAWPLNNLWIDSLCILQDSVDDWRAESPKMSQILHQTP